MKTKLLLKHLKIGIFALFLPMISCQKEMVSISKPIQEKEINKSAYDVWKEFVENNYVLDPTLKKLEWDKTKTSIEDFLEYTENYRGTEGKYIKNLVYIDKDEDPYTSKGYKEQNSDPYTGDLTYQLYLENGVSSFQIWRNHIATGNVKNPHYGKFEEEYKDITNDKYWDYKRNSIEDYFLFITNPRHVE